ncbi:hypothetical protein F3K44_33115 [Bacillus megaterium]|nr:hypothetical protein [Priestia megaterium]NGY94069.1 hypothetical protein [Priestia megaterium]
MTMTANPADGTFKDKMRRLGKANNAVIFICNNTFKEEGERVVVYLPTRTPLFISNEQDYIYKFQEFITKID